MIHNNLILTYKAKILLLLLTTSLIGKITIAQQSHEPYLLHWTEKDGLSDRRVNALIKDQRGWLWVGTSNGLSRFDGKTFETFRYDPKNHTSVAANEVFRIMESENGNIWVGTDGGGLSVYDHQENSFTRLRQNLKHPEQGLTEDRVYNFLQDGEEILIGYRAIGSGKGGLTIVSEDLKIKEHLLQNVNDYAGFPMKVTRSFKDTNEANVYWLGGRSFFKWNRKTGATEEFTHPSFLPNYTSLSGIAALTDSTLLVGLLYDGLWIFDKKNKQWLKKIHDQPVHAFIIDEQEKIWIADAKGLGWLDPNDDFNCMYEIQASGPQSPFDDGIHISYLFLVDGNFWLATSHGLYCWIYTFEQFNVNQLDINDEEQVYYPEFIGASSANEWIFMDRNRGLVISDSLLRVKRLIPMPDKTKIRKACFYKNETKAYVLIGAERGFYKWTEGEEQIYPLTLDSATVDLQKVQPWSIYIDDVENAWIGTQTSGLIKIDLKENQVTQFLRQPGDSLSLCHNKYLFEIEKDINDNLWVCTDKGISIIDPRTEKFVNYPGLEKIQNYVVHAAKSDHQENIWIGTRDQGLFRYHIPTGKLSNFTVTNGLLYNGVNEIALEDSILWLATRQGLCNLNINTEAIINFDQNKGLYKNTLNDARLKKLPDNKIMLTYQNSSFFSVFKNEELKSHFPAPDLVINSIRILSNKNKKSLVMSGESNIHLGPYENYFAIDFTGIHFFQPRDIRYQYKLEGYDESWIEAGKTNTAIYTNLPGGQYQFKVKAANADKQWSETQSLSIFLATPWYETNWFFTIIAMVLLGLIYLLYKYRMNQFRKEENFKQKLAETEMKALRSQINPHFIFNCLNSIKGYIIENRIEDGTAYVGRFAQLIRMILNHSKEKLIPISREIEAIKLYIWLEQERLNHKFDVAFELSFTSNPDHLKIPPLIFQPYIENAIWHGLMHLERKGNLVLRIKELPDVLSIEILDNGIGRQASIEQKRNSVFKKPSMGIEISAGRLEQINQLYQLKSKVDITDQFSDRIHPGTRVTITFPKIKTNVNAKSNHS